MPEICKCGLNTGNIKWHDNDWLTFVLSIFSKD
jgi:hypothetical protein